MTDWLDKTEAEVLQRIQHAPRLFCFLDYDGTLAPLAPTPDEAIPLPGTAELLAELIAAPGVQVALVSGRPIADVRRFLDVPGLYYVGVHGLELKLPNGPTELTEAPGVIPAVIPWIKKRLEQVLDGRPGILIEDKRTALALHYRQSSPADRATARQVLASLVRTYQQRGVPVRLTFGHEVAEVRPRTVNKGKTVSGLLAVHGPEALAIYIGDDRTDEDAFTYLPADAITIRVGATAEPTNARYRTERPADVQRFLRAVLARRRQTGRDGSGEP